MESTQKTNIIIPEILAPAGNRDAFLAAIAAKADAIYCGLKQFSARMEAENFNFDDLISLVDLAHEKNTKVYLTLNTLLKPNEIGEAYILISNIAKLIKPDALIIQDMAFAVLAKQSDYKGELHLSTLANVTFSDAFIMISKKLKINRVVLPRELSIDEIKTLSQNCQNDINSKLDLEIFVHGALCYGVSGRCYWSSFHGGKSSLRGRCVQPCRRFYTQNNKKNRFFSCNDFCIESLVKLLLPISKIKAWKIEGRKKGAHYVFNTARAYRLLRDHGKDPNAKKEAISLISEALGRPTTHYNFLPQKPKNPINILEQTGSGFIIGKVQGSPQKPYFITKIALLPGDKLRIGYEDESDHGVYTITKYVPMRGRWVFANSFKTVSYQKTPVFLVDRREKELEKMITDLKNQINKNSILTFNPNIIENKLNRSRDNKPRSYSEVHVYRYLLKNYNDHNIGLWISPDIVKKLPKKNFPKIWWWLPPVIWPKDEALWKSMLDFILQNKGNKFILNAPWQIALFEQGKKFDIWAGPFCNISNSIFLKVLADQGFSGSIVSPELSQNDYIYLAKDSPLPLGIVISGNWPLSISRTFCESLNIDLPFESPKGEKYWAKKVMEDYWIYPNWELNLIEQKEKLYKAGYSKFIYIHENLPQNISLKKRPGLWNWDLELR